jgi:hypothetical protein
MLGDLIYEAKDKVTSIRGVIDVKGGVFADLGGAYYTECKGVFMAKDDDSEMVTWIDIQ